MTEPWGSPGRELAEYAPPPLPAEPDGEDDGERAAPLVSLQELRYVRNPRPTVGERIEFAREAAYSTGTGGWRRANILFSFTVVPVVAHATAAADWAFGRRLGRFLVSVPVLLSLLFVLNHIPLTAWLVWDGADVSTWLVPAPDPCSVEVPLDLPAGE